MIISRYSCVWPQNCDSQGADLEFYHVCPAGGPVSRQTRLRVSSRAGPTRRLDPPMILLRVSLFPRAAAILAAMRRMPSMKRTHCLASVPHCRRAQERQTR